MVCKHCKSFVNHECTSDGHCYARGSYKAYREGFEDAKEKCVGEVKGYFKSKIDLDSDSDWWEMINDNARIVKAIRKV